MAISRRRSSPFSSPRRALAVAAALPWLWAAAAGADPAAVSADGRWHLQAQGLELVLRDAVGAGPDIRRWPTRALQGGPASPVLAIVPVATRRSFVVAFEQLAELWELQLDPAAEPVFNGWVHDYRMGEGIAEPGYLGRRRTRLPGPISALALDASGAWVLVRGADAADGRAVLHLLQLDIRQAAARLVVDADPALDRATSQPCGQRACLAVPDRRGGPPLVVDLQAARLR